MNKRHLFLTTIIFLLAFTLLGQELKLRYDTPASIWEEALPLGNSRLGAMVYGNPSKEEIQLNEETIWAGSPHRNDNPKAAEALPEVQELIFQKKYEEVDKLINEAFFGGPHGMPYQTAGSLMLHFEGHQDYQDYYRELDLDKAVATTRYKVDGVTYTREIFSSFADDVIIMRLTADKKRSLTFEAKYQNPSQHTITKNNDRLVLRGKGGDHEGISGKIFYEIHTQVKHKDGNVNVNENTISVTDATEAIIYISLGTNFRDYKTIDRNPSLIASELLKTATGK